MATYRLKRKYFGLADAAQNTLGNVGNAIKTTAGGVLEGAGKVAKSGVGKAVGAWQGAKLGFATGGILGGAIGAIGGAALAKGIGKGAVAAGQDLQM